jgi:uncharacterized protein
MNRIPRPRTPDLALDSSIPPHWFGGDAHATHIANGANLLFPAGERFFVRSVRRYLPQIEGDSELTARVRGFFGQEGRHANAHERFFDVMEAQGYAVRRFVDVYERVVYDQIAARLPPALQLSITVALEHYTALLGAGVLKHGVFASAHPAMQRLMEWHAAEEIEHRDVAFDVLRKVRPSYALRMAGLVIATVALACLWILATVMLARQDARLGRAEHDGAVTRVARMGILRHVFLHGMREYVQPGFHPAQNDTTKLAEDYLASVGAS